MIQYADAIRLTNTEEMVASIAITVRKSDGHCLEADGGDEDIKLTPNCESVESCACEEFSVGSTAPDLCSVSEKQVRPIRSMCEGIKTIPKTVKWKMILLCADAESPMLRDNPFPGQCEVIPITKEDDFLIWGIVTTVIKSV